MPQQPDPRFIPDKPEDERFIPDEESPSLMRQAWDTAITPLTTIPSDIGRKFADWYTEPTLANMPTGEGGFHDYMAGVSARARGFLGGAAEGLGNVASELTSPLNLATMGLFKGSTTAGKMGYEETAKWLSRGARTAAAPFAIHGATVAADPNLSLGERGMGLTEVAMGTLGMMHSPIASKGARKPLSSPAIEPGLPVRPSIHPGVAEPIAARGEPNITGFDDIFGPNVIDTKLSNTTHIQSAYEKGQITQAQAIILMEDIYKKELKTKRKTKAPEPKVEPIPEVDVTSKVPDKLVYIVEKEVVNPNFIVEARNKGYEFTGLNDKGDFRFKKAERIKTETPPIEESIIPPVEEISLPPEPTPTNKTVVVSMGDKGTWVSPGTQEEFHYLQNMKRASEGLPDLPDSVQISPERKAELYKKFFERKQIPGEAPPPPYEEKPFPLTTEAGPTVPKPAGVQEVIDLITSGQVKNVAELQNVTKYSFNKTKTLWYAAKEQIKASKMPEGFFDKMSGVPKVVQDAIPPVKPLNQLPTPEGLGKVIKDIPKTGNEDLDTAIKALRAMRRRKGIDQFNELETKAYNDLMDKVKNHPALPGKIFSKWEGLAERFKSEKGELVIRPGKEEPFHKSSLDIIPKGGELIVKHGKATPDVVKTLFDNGFRFAEETVTGDIRFKRIEMVAKAPLLESDVLPTPKEKTKPDTEIGMPRQIYDLSRGLMSVDPPFVTSAAFRQAMPWAGTKNWFKSWNSAAKAFGEKAWYDARMKQIKESPLYRKRYLADGTEVKSFAEEIGIRMTDLKDVRGTRTEGIKSQLAERLPGVGRYVAASNRAFSAFLNDLRYTQLEAFIQDGKTLAKIHKDPKLDFTRNIPLAKELAQFLNDTTGAGTLKTGFGEHQYSLEMHAQKLADVFFSPRLMASRIRMLNPSTYMMANPVIRKQYTYAMLRTVAAWWGIAQLGSMAGGEVVTDPNNPDFGKIKIGDTRLDPGAGFQQFLVLGSRIKPDWMHLPIEPTDTGIMPLDLATGYLGTPGGQYSSSISGKSQPFGQGFNPLTRTSAIGNFLAQKLHPTAKLIFDIGAVNERQPVYVLDRLIQLYVPMMSGDIAELMNEHPELIPLVIPFSGVGGGSQTYTGAPTTPIFTPMLGLDKYDIQIGGKQ